MAKKSFTENAVTPFYKAVEAEVTQEAQPAQDEYDARNTQGKAGMKAERINMAFSPANYEFMRVMAGLHKMTLTKYVNHLIEEERKRSAELYQKAKDLMNNL